MVERRNAVALVIGVMVIVSIWFVILPAFGLNPPNPFQAHAVVSITPRCILSPLHCQIGSDEVIITFNRPFQGKILSSISQVSDAPLLAIAPSSYSGVCQWSPILPPGGDFKFILEIPELNYRKVVPNHLESTSEDIDFTGIPMIEGRNYQYKLRVWWAPTDDQCLLKEGLGSI